MFRGEDNRGDIDATDLRRRAFELGVDVGENGHIESVGWVNLELRSIMAKAEQIGILEEVQKKYMEGKKSGVARRSKYVMGQGGGKADSSLRIAPRMLDKKPARRTSGGSSGFVERISPEEGLKSTINVIKFTADKPEVKKDLNGLFAGIFDLQERLLDIQEDPDQRKTFNKCLEFLTEVGWIENSDLTHFDQHRAVVKLLSTTAIARAFGHSDDPVCQPICNLFETVGRKTFRKSVIVTELECVAQGRSACKFEISPR
ncbi:MAG: hypothetical protein JSV94_05105 [Methanobacteriota archaeon]|nr:MAG: hypothetical protein JSV94_05105 [Euryarchaeota archaeon]